MKANLQNKKTKQKRRRSIITIIYMIKLTRSCGCFLTLSFGFGSVTQLRCYAIQINVCVNIMNVHFERNNLQLEMI